MSSPDTAAAAATQKKDSEDANAPLVQILRLFRGWFLTRSETKAGRLEAVAMFGICLARAAEVHPAGQRSACLSVLLLLARARARTPPLPPPFSLLHARGLQWTAVDGRLVTWHMLV